METAARTAIAIRIGTRGEDELSSLAPVDEELTGVIAPILGPPPGLLWPVPPSFPPAAGLAPLDDPPPDGVPPDPPEPSLPDGDDET